MNKFIQLSAIAGASCLLAVSAQAAVIDFEEVGLQNSTNPSNDSGFETQGFRFGRGNQVIDVSDGSPWASTGPAYSGDFAVLSNFGSSIEMTKVGGGTFDVFDFFAKGWANQSYSVVANSFLDGQQIGSVSFNVSSDFTHVTTNFLGVDRVTFNQRGTGIAILVDDINTAVPEPAIWAMMLAGFGVVGYSLRRRNVSYRPRQAA